MTHPTPSTSTCPRTDTSSDEEWDEIRCPICMDHPHNAVKLSCSSVNCRCFICNTSYRHSNCFDRFKGPPLQNNTGNSTEENMTNLKCPMCRGDVTGWTVNEEARQNMDKKSRDCSRDRCEFQGNYEELRRHARKDHPLNRPAEVDILRQRQWRHLEQQQELGDVMSAIRSEIPGAVVVGDYAVEADEVSALNDATVGNSDGSSSLLTTLVLGPIMGSRMRSSREDSRESQVEPPTSHAGRRRRRGRYLWGEILLGLQYDDGGSESHDDGDVYDNDGGNNNNRILRRRLDTDDGTITRVRHPGGNDNRDGNTIQREDVEDANVEDTDADNSSDGVGNDDGFVFGDGDEDDNYVNNAHILRRRLDSDDGNFARVRHPGGNDNHDGNTIQREDVEDTSAGDTDADNSSDGDGHDDDFVFGNDDDDDDYVNDEDSDDGTDRPSRW